MLRILTLFLCNAYIEIRFKYLHDDQYLKAVPICMTTIRGLPRFFFLNKHNLKG